MVAVFLKYPHLLDETPGLGDLKTAPPRQGDYVSYTLLLYSRTVHCTVVCSCMRRARNPPTLFTLSTV